MYYSSKNQRNKWADGWSAKAGFNNRSEDALPFNGVIIPKGTIEKLIGRKLTFENEPVELTESEQILIGN